MNINGVFHLVLFLVICQTERRRQTSWGQLKCKRKRKASFRCFIPTKFEQLFFLRIKYFKNLVILFRQNTLIYLNLSLTLRILVAVKSFVHFIIVFLLIRAARLINFLYLFHFWYFRFLKTYLTLFFCYNILND
jgi:hypothetical protein